MSNLPPPVPSTRSNTFACLGDSISAHNSTYQAPAPTTTTQVSMNYYGYLAWARALSGGSISFNPQNNFGVNGDTLGPTNGGVNPGMMSRVSSVIASGVKNCIVLGGHNDIDLTPTPTPLATMISQLKTICSQLVGAGITVCLMTLVPITGLSASQYESLLSFNTFIRFYALNTAGIVLVDPWPWINDYTQSSPQQKAYYGIGDTIHPGPKSAYLMGLCLWNAIQRTLPAYVGMTGVSQGDTYNATNGPYSNLLANGYFSGSGGTLNATAGGATNCTLTGTAATGWTIQKYSGSSVCTATASIESPRTDLGGFSNGNRQVIAFSTTNSGGVQEQLQMNSATVNVGSGYSAGDLLYGEAVIEIDAPTNLYTVWLELSENHTSGYQQAYDMDITSIGNNQYALMLNQAGNLYLTLRTPVIQTLSNSQSVNLQVAIVFYPSLTGGASATVKVADAAIRHSAGWTS